MHSLLAQKFLLDRIPTFTKSHFSLLIVLQILRFTNVHLLQLQKRFIQKVQKVLDFGGFAPSPARRMRATAGVARTLSPSLCAFQESKYFFKFYFTAN